MSDSTTTFADTNVYGGIYFCTYIIICLVIIIGGFYFSSKYKLYYETYQALNDIENEFGIATIGVNALEIKYNINNKGDKKRARDKVANVEIKDVRNELKLRFKNIYKIIENHEMHLNHKIDKIEKVKDEKDDADASNEKDDDTIEAALKLTVELQTKKKFGNDEVEFLFYTVQCVV